MLRAALALSALLIPVFAGAQPSRETLLRDVRHDDDAVRPKFVTLTPAQVEAKTTAALLEIDDGVMVVQSVEVELPKGDNSQYAVVEFEPPNVRDDAGGTVSIERQSGMRNETRNSVEHRLLVPGGDAPARFATVAGRVTVSLPLTVETRTIRNGDRESLASAGATIDGPFVRYRRELVPEVAWLSDLRPVRAYDANGKALDHEGTYPDRVNGDGFEMVAFHGAPATVELDVPGETATLTIDYDLTLGNRKATKITKRLGEGESRAEEPPARIDSADALAQLKRLNYPAIDADQLLAAAANGDTKAVALLLGGGVAPDAEGSSGMTALHVATAVNEQEVVDLLLASGADVNALDANGLTALFGLAARCDQSAVVAKLIARGAKVNVKGTSPVSPLDLAKAMNCTEIVQALTKAGAR